MGITVTPLNPQTITAWQVETVNALDLVKGLGNLIVAQGYTATIRCAPNHNDPAQPVSWRVDLSLPGYPEQTANIGDWIVFDGKTAKVYSNDEFNSAYAPAGS